MEPDHEIWQHIQRGDSIEVVAECIADLLPNDCYDAVIRVFESWEPTSAMLTFL